VTSWRDALRFASVFVGGAAGTALRWAVGLALPTAAGAFPWATFTVNMSGAFGLGFIGVLIAERLRPTVYLRTLIGVGFFGAYTTFSTMAVDGIRLLDEGKPHIALLYWLATLMVGQMAGAYGIWLRRLERRVEEREPAR
jgi:fluoride exporter